MRPNIWTIIILVILLVVAVVQVVGHPLAVSQFAWIMEMGLFIIAMSMIPEWVRRR